MNNKNKKLVLSQKHLTYLERDLIEQGLNDGLTFSELAKSLLKHKSTISKEIKKHRIEIQPSSYNGGSNLCANKYSCKVRHACRVSCSKKCSSCYLCNAKCSEFIKNSCSKISLPPYVCNSCKTRSHCRHLKFIYHAKDAHSSYKLDLAESRAMINLTPLELMSLDALISPLIKKGQPLNHILANNKEQIPCTTRTIYNYIDKGYLGVSNIDLPRKVSYRKRRTFDKSIKTDAKCRINRTYSDFVDYMNFYPNKSIVEMDLVEGSKGGKLLLTLLFKNTYLMMAFLIDNKKSETICNIFNMLHNKLGTKCFKNLFQVILTDNGSEFSNPIGIERDSKGKLRTKLFYCDPYTSCQKGTLEHNHEYIRYILPKGKSFDDLTQEKVVLMMNHINSTSREILNNKTPFDMSEILLSKKALECLELTRISANEILLKPSLLKK